MFSKEKTIVVTVDDFIWQDALCHTEFTGQNGGPCLVQAAQDMDCGNPRQMSDTLWTWVTTSGAGYSDKKDDYPFLYQDGEGALDKQFLKDNLMVPLYLHRHSGDSISAGGYGANWLDIEWDAGCMGFAYLSREKIREEYGWKIISEKRREKLISYLKSEVNEMNAWLSGDVYGIQVIDMQSEKEDSCWGFIGQDRLCEAVRDMLDGWCKDEERYEIAKRLTA